MNPDQKIVFVGAVSGIAGMLALNYILTLYALPAPMLDGSAGARLAYALGANVFAIIPLFLMLITVGNERFLSEAIDPLRHAESRTMEINGRVLQNTLEQNFMFFIASLAVSTIVPLAYLQVVWACAITFVAGRLLFWAGYQKNPLYRAPGLSSVAYMNLFMVLYVLYHMTF